MNIYKNKWDLVRYMRKGVKLTSARRERTESQCVKSKWTIPCMKDLKKSLNPYSWWTANSSSIREMASKTEFKCPTRYLAVFCLFKSFSCMVLSRSMKNYDTFSYVRVDVSFTLFLEYSTTPTYLFIYLFTYLFIYLQFIYKGAGVVSW